MNKSLICYLAGPIDFINKESSMGWRKEVENIFNNEIKDGIIKIRNPWRRPHGTGLSNKEIYLLDLKDIRESDVILADIRQVQVETYGTASEIFYAYEILKIPVIGWYDEPSKGNRLFLDVMVAKQIQGLKNACEHISHFYT